MSDKADNTSCEQAFHREREARQRAEKQLEHRTRELFNIHSRLQEQHRDLQQSNAELEHAHEALKQAQVQLIQNEKLASVGQLAAGIAHEINNPVAFIMSNLSMMKDYVASFDRLFRAQNELLDSIQADASNPFSEMAEMISEIQKQEDIDYLIKDSAQILKESLEGTDRVKEIVQSLKSFARIDEAEATAADINECIETTLKVVSNELKYKCDIVKNLAPLPLIHCYPGQLNQVFANLLVNAAHAIDKHGKIEITSKADKDTILITVTDTGRGIPENILPKIFTPFFTTKKAGEGTGLGLSISYSIIEQHGGAIDVDSKNGKGTTFTIRIPITGIDKDG